MALFLNADPTLPDHTIQTVLGDDAYRIRYVWRERIGAWFVDVALVDTSRALAADASAQLPLMKGRRLCPGRVTSQGIGEGWSGGLLFCVGRDDAPREALGSDDLCLVWYSQDEIDAQAITPEDADVVELI